MRAPAGLRLVIRAGLVKSRKTASMPSLASLSDKSAPFSFALPLPISEASDIYLTSYDTLFLGPIPILRDYEVAAVSQLELRD